MVPFAISGPRLFLGHTHHPNPSSPTDSSLLFFFWVSSLVSQLEKINFILLICFPCPLGVEFRVDFIILTSTHVRITPAGLQRIRNLVMSGEIPPCREAVGDREIPFFRGLLIYTTNNTILTVLFAKWWIQTGFEPNSVSLHSFWNEFVFTVVACKKRRAKLGLEWADYHNNFGTSIHVCIFFWSSVLPFLYPVLTVWSQAGHAPGPQRRDHCTGPDFGTHPVRHGWRAPPLHPRCASGTSIHLHFFFRPYIRSTIIALSLILAIR